MCEQDIKAQFVSKVCEVSSCVGTEPTDTNMSLTESLCRAGGFIYFVGIHSSGFLNLGPWTRRDPWNEY